VLRSSCLALLVLLGCSRGVEPLPDLPPAATPVPAPVAFPRDALPHDALTEWWYFTGHLQTADRHSYGFEFTIFQARRQDAPTGYLAHFAVTDVDGQRFSHEARASQGEPRLAFPLQVQDWVLLNDSAFEAAMDDGAFGLRLRFMDEKPPVLHHGGFIENEPAGGSYYYSRTRLAATGELQVAGGDPIPVSGQAWMDHQWGDFVVAAGGWDWYSLQLDDMTELMLYVLRRPSGEVSAVYGSQVLPNGSVRDLAANEVRPQPLGTWQSPHTGAVYPSGWRLTLADGEELVVRPLVVDQELYFPGFGGLAYWEGAVSVGGSRTGRGYVELTGYAGQ
jgi:predicted secreted hydrolase